MKGGALEELLKKDHRYQRAAYGFVMDSLAYTVRRAGERRHVTGRELLFGIRDFALDCWGPMARHVLNAWGVHATDDFGEIVFNLVDIGLMSKTDEDRKDEFRDVYGFVEAFDQASLPELDEHGHVRRRLPGFTPQSWSSFLGNNEGD
ncbi:MAG: Minf_1886 family protein [Planctomycetota bacterium]